MAGFQHLQQTFNWSSPKFYVWLEIGIDKVIPVPLQCRGSLTVLDVVFFFLSPNGGFLV